MDKRIKTLLAPEYVYESNGIACGDKVSLYAYRIDGDLFFSFLNTGCSISVSIADYLEDNLSGNKESYVRERLDEIMDNIELYFDFPIHRKECAMAPIRLLQHFFDNVSKCDVSKNDVGKLACDACVKMQRIDWNSKKKHEEITKMTEVDEKDESNVKVAMLQRLGCCVLSDEMQKRFQDEMQSFREEYISIIKKYRLAAPFYNNAKKYNLRLAPIIKELAIKQKTSLAVAESEISVIDVYIKKNDLYISAVKGGRTGEYYPEGMFRAHMDFDYLAHNVADASSLIGYLINDRQFKMVIGGSVPFSFKSVLDKKHMEQITGHIHLEKILQDRFQVVVDINMGGFPLGRTGIMKFDGQEKELEIEKLICITLAHLFKHEIVFMKDINDLYYLLGDDSVNEEKLYRLLHQYNLDDYFTIAYGYIQNNMRLNRLYKTKDNIRIESSVGARWPYSSKSHFELKKKELVATCVTQYGNDMGMKEAQRQISGGEGVCVSEKYKDICYRLNTRTTVYPLMIFKKPIIISEGIGIKKIMDGLWIKEGIVLLSFGMFLIQNDKTNLSREKVEKLVESIMIELSIDPDMCNFDYIMEARKDTWLY